MIIAYYGDGKGKTTAALGVCLRALGRGFSVAVLQFIKGEPDFGADIDEGAVKWTTGERLVNKELNIPDSKFMIKAVGEGFYKIQGDSLDEAKHQQAADNGVKESRELIQGGKYKVVVLDEIVRALDEGLVSQAELFELIDLAKAGETHLILTGHKIKENLIDRCDLVSEVSKIKHPFDEGKLAIQGIDY